MGTESFLVATSLKESSVVFWTFHVVQCLSSLMSRVLSGMNYIKYLEDNQTQPTPLAHGSLEYFNVIVIASFTVFSKAPQRWPGTCSAYPASLEVFLSRPPLSEAPNHA